MWKSSFAFSTTQKAKIQKACGITYPTCTAGLSCWPGTQRTDARTGQITCTAYNTYKALGCSHVDPDDPSTWGSSGESGGWESSSTGVVAPVSGGMSVGLIALIVVLVLVGVVAIGGYFYYVKRQQPGATQGNIPGLGTDGLLGTGHTDSSSEGVASGSDYYAQQPTGTA